MRPQALTIAFLALALSVHAQRYKSSVLYHLVMERKHAAVAFSPIKLFTQKNNIAANKTAGQEGIPVANVTLDKKAVSDLYRSKKEALVLSIPSNASKSYVLDLIKQDINDVNDFSFGTISKNGRVKTSSEQGLHYRGCIDGDSNSIASVSVFSNGEVMGVFSNSEGNYTIGRTDTLGSNYIIYNINELPIPGGFICSTDEDMASEEQPNAANTDVILSPTTVPPLLCKKVRFYWEASDSLYSYNFNSNLTATQNYITGLFNQVATMFQNEGIIVELAQVYVWTSVDPYRNDSSGHALLDFRNYWRANGNAFNGDIAHLIAGGKTNNGGIAYLRPDLCTRSSNYAYSNVYASYKTVPAYSWDVNVVTHEIGHNMGSHHTHWCGWNTGAGGTCGAIDNCYKVESSDTCSTCKALTDTATRPVGWKGTVMSYCHLTSKIGIDLANGFGPLPQAAIRNSITNSSCLLGVQSWSGTVSTAWENANNWSCGTIPTATTDVTITQGAPNYPIVNSAATCHKLIAPSGVSVQVNTGHTLNITGVDTH